MSDETERDLATELEDSIEDVEQPEVETEETEPPKPKSAREEAMERITKARREGVKKDGLTLPDDDEESADADSATPPVETAMDDQPPPGDRTEPIADSEEAEDEPAVAAAPTPSRQTVAPPATSEPDTFDIKAKRRALYDAMMAGEYDQADQVQGEIDDYQYRQFELRQQGRELTREYNSVASELETQYPALAPGGDADRQRDVLALKTAYQSQGLTPAEALQRAVGTLSRTWDDAPATDAGKPKISDQQQRLARKQQTVVSLPTATARATPKPAPKPKTQAQAIQEMKRARGQL